MEFIENLLKEKTEQFNDIVFHALLNVKSLEGLKDHISSVFIEELQDELGLAKDLKREIEDIEEFIDYLKRKGNRVEELSAFNKLFFKIEKASYHYQAIEELMYGWVLEYKKLDCFDWFRIASGDNAGEITLEVNLMGKDRNDLFKAFSVIPEFIWAGPEVKVEEGIEVKYYKSEQLFNMRLFKGIVRASENDVIKITINCKLPTDLNEFI